MASMHAAPPTTTPAALDVRPLTASIGATIHDLELRHASDDQVADVRNAVLRHRVVFLRGQSLDEDDLRSVAGRFGTLARSPLHQLLGRDTTTSVIEDTADRPPAGFAWHTDLSWTAAPPSLGFLHALEIPAVGVDTIWSNQVAAIDTLGELNRVLDDPHLQVRWRWAEGDLAIWDERSTCHRALVDHHPQRRRMRRCVVAGAPPVPA